MYSLFHVLKEGFPLLKLIPKIPGSAWDRRLEALQTLVLPGGLQVRSDNKVISPGCCCGLETWRDWLRFLKTGAYPWLGHDPSPSVEKVGGLIRVWSDKKSRRTDKKVKVFYIDFEQSKFEEELSKVQQDLKEFLTRIEVWVDSVGF